MLKLAAHEIVVEFADGRKGLYSRFAIEALNDCGRIAKFVKRRKDGAITRAFALAMPGEIAKPSHRTATVIHDFPMTYSHNMRACEGYAISDSAMV